MSQIEKLLIRGVRSFDPHKEETVQFYTPLTLIVGHNGSGKTVSKRLQRDLGRQPLAHSLPSCSSSRL